MSQASDLQNITTNIDIVQCATLNSVPERINTAPRVWFWKEENAKL